MQTISRGSWPLRLLKISLVLAGLGLVALLALTAFFSTQLPDTSSLSNYQPKQPLRVLTADGVEVAGFGTERRVYKPIDQIPRLMKDSLLAVEDARFYEHGGLDPIGVARAIVANLTGGRTQGASTITQQVARTFFLSRSRTLERKIKEALLAFKIESQLSKDQILELYMNQIYLGSRAYGFEAAAQAYFGKTLSALSAAESAMLAGLPQNPHFANPIQNFERARARQLLVLGRMRAQDVITDAQFQAAKAEKLVVRKRNEVDVHAEHVAEMVRQQVYAQFGEMSYTTGLNVTTTLRAAEQQAAYKALRRTLVEHSLRQVWRGPEGQETLATDLKDDDPAVAQALADYDDDEDLRIAIVTRASTKSVTVVLGTGEVVTIEGTGLRPAQSGLAESAAAKLRVRRGAVVRVVQQAKAWSLVQWPEAEGALVAMDPLNGDIRALVGGFDFHRNQFNHVTRGWRQPGSSYKPFIYSGAIESGMQPESLVNDAPMENVGDWAPENDDGSTDGPITLRRALARSKNLVSIRLMQLLSPQGAREWVSRFGFDPERQPDNLTQALGSGSTNPLQMAGAYSVLANGGYRVNPVLIQKIARASGEVVFEAKPQVLDETLRTVPARNTFMVSSLLQEVTRSGTAAKAQAALKRPDLYGKTGTTNDVVDAWFAGYQPGVVAVVWVGYDTPRSLGTRASGSALALPAWIDYMSVALNGVPVQEVQPPEGVVRAGDDWRYAEWAEGGFIESLGVDGQAISPALAVKPTPQLAEGVGQTLAVPN
ncbi:PBP1A family penicillin-binding protein [Rhodoferax sp. TBRC 17198]|uniref:penicillin-binding protein 1A n=1 Tax=Rhodoferax potami TaxID=3068338 RepID=UPI0028BE60AA|nr:PBP1A family penicillin-binding protein [Rhodoferax sp. TBRC 17198]MDT7524043.1 PBP1A family penicillin-binding protein [Rhodoferax sp. TBRC 17198]